MHSQSVRMIVFRGPEGKKAMTQILSAKPLKNKFSMTVKERSEDFSRRFSTQFSSSPENK